MRSTNLHILVLSNIAEMAHILGLVMAHRGHLIDKRLPAPISAAFAEHRGAYGWPHISLIDADDVRGNLCDLVPCPRG